MYFGCMDFHFGCLDLYLGCLDLYFGCLDFYFGCLDFNFGCLNLYFGCLDLYLGCLNLYFGETSSGKLRCAHPTVSCYHPSNLLQGTRHNEKSRQNLSKPANTAIPPMEVWRLGIIPSAIHPYISVRYYIHIAIQLYSHTFKENLKI